MHLSSGVLVLWTLAKIGLVSLLVLLLLLIMIRLEKKRSKKNGRR